MRRGRLIYEGRDAELWLVDEWRDGPDELLKRPERLLELEERELDERELDDRELDERELDDRELDERELDEREELLDEPELCPLGGMADSFLFVFYNSYYRGTGFLYK